MQLNLTIPTYRHNFINGKYFNDLEACRTSVEVKILSTHKAIELKVIATID